MPDDPHSSWLEGLRLRRTDPRALLPFAARLAARQAERDRVGGSGTASLAAQAELFTAYGLLAHGDRPGAEAAASRARGLIDIDTQLDAAAVARHFQCGMWVRDDRLDDALRGCDATLAMPSPGLSMHARLLAIEQRAGILEMLGRYDDALRSHHESVALARRAGTPVELACTLAALGGLQSSLLNLADAQPACDEAWSLCGRTEWYGVIHIAGHNRMKVLSLLDRHDEGVAMAEHLLPLDERFPARNREVRQALCASTFARAGHLDRAQALLDLIRDAQPELSMRRAEWVWMQAMIHNRRARPDAALALLLPYIERYQDSLNGSRFPVDRAQLYAQAALACEARRELAEALAFERSAAAAREQAAAQSAHARRLTLQIEHDLDAAFRARDSALREQARAQQEQQRLAELNAALEAASAAKTRFLAAASHDLRQPVQALAMYMATLQQERSAAGRARLMSRMNQSLQSLGGLFDVLLDLSRLDAGLVPVTPAPLRLDELLRRLADEHTLPAREKRLVVRLRLPPGPAVALSDAALLETCLRNLVGNAIKYTERGGVVLRLRALPDAPRWRIEVRDTGIGIAPAAQALVFQEFYQVGNEERDRRKGLGLGLSIVRRSAELLDHPIGLRSRPGRGSCFHLDVPRAASAEAADAVPDELHDGTAQGIVVIDDDTAVRDSLATLLHRWGHRVIQGADAGDALDAWVAQGRPTIGGAIVDLRLRGGRTGLEAIADLRAQMHAELPALVVTGDTAPQRLQLLAERGQPWLPKPLMPLRLRSWLRALPARDQ